MNKDLILYIANLADDRAVLNMFSTNKKFRNPENFKRIFQQRYPLVMRFKPEDMSWTRFYIQTIYYLAELKEKYGVDYVPTYDFDPKEVYTFVLNAVSKGFASHRLLNLKDYIFDGSSHTLIYPPTDPNLQPEIAEFIIPTKSLERTVDYYHMDKKYGYVISESFYPEHVNPAMESESSLPETGTSWVGLLVLSDLFSSYNSEGLSNMTLSNDPEYIITNLFRLYLREIDMIVEYILDEFGPQPTREEILALHTDDPYGDGDYTLFREEILKPEGVLLKVNMDGETRIRYFQMVQRKLVTIE